MSKSLTDNDLMPFGKHRGTRMEDVPAKYLVWLKEDGCSHAGVLGYIRDHWSLIKSECPDHIFKD